MPQKKFGQTPNPRIPGFFLGNIIGNIISSATIQPELRKTISGGMTYSNCIHMQPACQGPSRTLEAARELTLQTVLKYGLHPRILYKTNACTKYIVQRTAAQKPSYLGSQEPRQRALQHLPRHNEQKPSPQVVYRGNMQVTMTRQDTRIPTVIFTNTSCYDHRSIQERWGRSSVY